MVHSLSSKNIRKGKWDISVNDGIEKCNKTFFTNDNFKCTDRDIFIPRRLYIYKSLIFRKPKIIQIPIILNFEDKLLSVTIVQPFMNDTTDFIVGTSLSLLNSTIPTRNFKIPQTLKEGFSFVNHQDGGMSIVSNGRIFNHNILPNARYSAQIPFQQIWMKNCPHIFKFQYSGETQQIKTQYYSTNLGTFYYNPVNQVKYLTILSDSASLTVNVAYKYPNIRSLKNICLTKTAHCIKTSSESFKLPIPNLLQKEVALQTNGIFGVNI